MHIVMHCECKESTVLVIHLYSGKAKLSICKL